MSQVPSEKSAESDMPTGPEGDAQETGQEKTPLGETAPEAPFALVALTYPVLLIVALIGFAALFWFLKG